MFWNRITRECLAVPRTVEVAEDAVQGTALEQDHDDVVHGTTAIGWHSPPFPSFPVVFVTLAYPNRDFIWPFVSQ